MRHESKINDADMRYGDNLLKCAEQTEKTALENEQWGVVWRIKHVLVGFLLIRGLQRLLNNSTQTLETAAERWLPTPEGSDPTTAFRNWLVEAGTSQKDSNYYVEHLQQAAIRVYGEGYNNLPASLRLRLVVEDCLGLTPQVFQTDNLQQLVEKSVIGELAKKLIEGQGDYSKLL